MIDIVWEYEIRDNLILQVMPNADETYDANIFLENGKIISEYYLPSFGDCLAYFDSKGYYCRRSDFKMLQAYDS